MRLAQSLIPLVSITTNYAGIKISTEENKHQDTNFQKVLYIFVNKINYTIISKTVL